MERARFEYLLAAYGADFARWPADERGAATIFAQQHAAEVDGLLTEARVLDAALDEAREPERDTRMLASRIVAKAPKPDGPGLNAGALLALAACAAFGVVLGYGGGLFAPLPAEDGAFFAMAFEAPMSFEDEG
jgi:hypothetical protein